MGIAVREKRGKLYLDIYWGGKRTWEALHLTLGKDSVLNKEARRLADIIRQKKEIQLVSGERGLVDFVGAKQSLLDYVRKQAEGQKSGDHLHRLIKFLEEYSGGGIQLQAVNARWVEGFKQYLLTCPRHTKKIKTKETSSSEKIISKRTASHMYKALGRIFSFAVRDMLIHKNPIESLRGISVPETILEYLTLEELEKLAGTSLSGNLGAEVKKAFIFACYTGLRIADIRSLTWGDIRREPLQILKRQKKTGRVVSIPLTGPAWDLIKIDGISRHDAAVFPLLASTGADTNKYLLRWAGRAGVGKRIGWHTARRTNATLLLENGADFSTVSRLLGHSGIQITSRYAQTTDKAKRRAVNGLPEIKLKEQA
jgi:integrase